MKLLSNAIVFKAELPCTESLENHLRDFAHKEVLPSSAQSFGFIENKITNEWVTQVEGGFAIQIQFDTKIMPADVIQREVDKRVDEYEKDGIKINKSDKKQIKIEVVSLLLPNAMVRSKVITAFYDVKSGFLIVDTTRKAISDLFISLLIKACGSVKTETINICDVKLGVTTKLKSHLLGDDSFNGFGVGNYCKVKNISTGELKTYEGADFECSPEYILDDFEQGFSVSNIQLCRNGLKFKLTDSFEFKQFKFEDIDDEEDFNDDLSYSWKREAGVRTLQVVDVITHMCDLVGYSEE